MEKFQFIYILLIIFNILLNLKAKRIFDVNNVKSCDDSRAVVLTNATKHVYGKNNRTVDMFFTVKKEVKSYFVVLNLTKCDLSGSQNSCEYFLRDFKTGDLCLKFEEKGQVWSSLVDSFTPKLQCPIKPGNYKATYPLSEDVFKFLPVPTGVWKTIGRVYDGDELVHCSQFEARIVQRK